MIKEPPCIKDIHFKLIFVLLFGEIYINSILRVLFVTELTLKKKVLVVQFTDAHYLPHQTLECFFGSFNTSLNLLSVKHTQNIKWYI